MISYLKKVFFLKSRNEKPLLDVNTECTICLTKIERPFKTKCNHVFHKECLDDWLKIKSNCPNCRKSLKYIHFKREEKGFFIRRLRRYRIAPAPVLDEEPELQIAEREPYRPPHLDIPQEQVYIHPPDFYEGDFEENGPINGECAECGRNVYASYKKHPDGNLIYHKTCFDIMFQRNRRQI